MEERDPAIGLHLDIDKGRTALRDVFATVVTIPDLDDQTLIELETMVETGDLTAASASVRAVLNDLGVTEDDVVSDSYSATVANSC